MPRNNGLLTPPSTPPPQHKPFTPTPPESRIGIYLGASLQLKGILGTGAYGVVYSALDHYTNTWYAVKALSKTNQNGEPLDQRQREFQAREIQLHYAASAHPNIVSMLKIVDDPECTFVILEFCPEGDLFSNITERGRYLSNDDLVRRAFLQILDAVEHCHRLGIYHRDLKPENILVSNSGQDVLLADFGLATTDPKSEDHGCGSTFYMSPECLDQSSRNASYRCAPNDIWSLGVVLVNLTCGRNPWKQASYEDSTYKVFARDPTFLQSILPLSDDLNSILCRIFERNPEDRITIGELKQRIHRCVNFSTPTCLSTPRTSSRTTADSNDGSIFSEGSLTGSCSTVSDTESDRDSGYESTENPQCDRYNVSHVEAPGLVIPSQVEQPASTTPFNQQYVLPVQDLQSNPWTIPAKHNPWFHPQGYQYAQPYGLATMAPFYHVYSPTHTPSHEHYNQFSRDCWQ